MTAMITMADPRFFTRSGPFTLAELVAHTGAAAVPQGADAARRFHDVAPLERAGAEEVSFLDNPKYAAAFANSKAGGCFVRPKYAEKAPPGMLLLVTEEPYSAYARAAQLFYPAPALAPFISPQAFIDESATIGEGCRIEAGAWIGPEATIGARCHVGAGAVIERGVTIGEEARIGANSTISHARIGNRVIIHRGVHIGQDGFGFAPGKNGILKVPQLGRVIIEDEVEIGSGTCIDRGAGPDTVIGAYTKIDNLVQIGHNCRIGRFVIISGQCGISGSTTIEDGAMLGGDVGIAGHVTIGKGAKLAARSGIMTDVPDGVTYGGIPAQPIKDWHRQTAALRKLAKRGKEE